MTRRPTLSRPVLLLAACLLSARAAAAEPSKEAAPAAPAAGADAQDPTRKPLTARDLAKARNDTAVDEVILRGANTIAISTLVDEAVDELVHDLRKLDENLVSPVAIRTVTVSSNLKAAFAQDLEARLVAALSQSTNLALVHCAACRALRSRVENGAWVVSMGPVDARELARLGESIGARTFLEIDYSYWSGTNTTALQARLVRASDSHILWSESYASDETTAALLRGSERSKSREERRQELERMMEGRPYYGYAAGLGTGYLSWDRPAGGVTGGTAMIRLYEKFGPNRESSFGLQVQGFVNLSAPLFGAFVGAVFMHDLSAPSLHLPELRVGGGLGGWLIGTEGNSFYVEGLAQMMLKFRFGLEAAVIYLKPTKYLETDLGGLGARAGLVFVW